MAEIGAALDANSSALVMVWEDLWATKFSEAVRNAGGVVVDLQRVPRDLVEAAIEYANAPVGAEAWAIPLVPEMEPETEAAPIAIAAPREEAIVPVAEAPVGVPLAEPAACTERSRSRRRQRGARRKARRRQKSAPSAPRASAQGRGGAKQAATSSFNNGFGNQGPW